MSLATTVSAMAAAGCSAQQIADVVAAHEAVETARRDEKRAKDAARKRRSRHAESRDVTRTSCDIAGQAVTDADIAGPHAIEHAPAELEPQTQEISYPKTPLKGVKKGEVLAPIAKPKSITAECLDELGKVLDPQHAQAVIDHRNRLRKPMTPHAAGLLAKSLSQAADPNAAADEMIERGWQGWKPSWGQNSQGPPRQANSRRSLIDALHRTIPDEQPDEPVYPRLAFGG